MKLSQIAMRFSWIFFVLFFALAIIDRRFALAGLLCMLLPLYQSIRGRGKIHCSGYCPRGSFLHNAFARLSFRNTMPAFMRSSIFKNLLFVLMMGFFAVSMFSAKGDLAASAMVLLRMVLVTSIIAAVLGIIFKPRSWCSICPMGHLSGAIARRGRKAA